MTNTNKQVGKSYKAMYKYELADAAGVSPKTFSRWLKHPRHAQALRDLNVPPRTRLLPPGAVRYICETFVIDIN